jgi:hypothetical protein
MKALAPWIFWIVAGLITLFVTMLIINMFVPGSAGSLDSIIGIFRGV